MLWGRYYPKAKALGKAKEGEKTHEIDRED
jgi:hypothetical protein